MFPFFLSFSWFVITRKYYIKYLRIRAFFHQTFQVYHVFCNLIIGCICRITVNFGTLKYESLLSNIFALNICFVDRNIFQNGVEALSKIEDAFLTKRWKFRPLRIIRFFSSNFANLWRWHLLWNYKWIFRLPISTFATVTRKTVLKRQLLTLIFAFKLFHVSIGVANSISSKYYL